MAGAWPELVKGLLVGVVSGLTFSTFADREDPNLGQILKELKTREL